MAEEPPERRFARVESGLYGYVVDHAGAAVWRSRSAAGRQPPEAAVLQPGQASFEAARTRDGGAEFVYRFGVAWEAPGGGLSAFMFSVAEDTRRYEKQVGAFRRTLWIWLGGAALVLVVVQAIVLKWSLRPLEQVAAEVDQVERGERDVLDRDHPREISRLTDSINTLLRSERERQRRYRNTMDDLAHSLKTPLAVLRGWLEARRDREDHSEAQRQIDRISQSVEYHLRRSASGASTFSKAVGVAPVLSELTSALGKVYADKNVKVTLEIPPDLEFFGDRGDLMEVLGNVLDNAFKYCVSCVGIAASPVGGSPRRGLRIVIRDDGEGFPDFAGNRVLERGVRADRRTDGQGIGLASAADIMEVYGGTLDVGNLPAGGAVVTIEFPAG
jgi:two-component system sensor histidine kinase PhoQ